MRLRLLAIPLPVLVVCLGAPRIAATEADRPLIKKSADLIVVADEEPWMAAVSVPLAKKLGKGGHPSLLIAVEYPPSARADWLIRRVAPHKALVLAPSEGVRLGPLLPGYAPEILPLGIDPVAGSFAVARRFWSGVDRAVVASADDLEAILLGALEAERLSLPLLIREPSETSSALLASVGELGIKQVVAAVAGSESRPQWARPGDSQIEVLCREALQERRVKALGRADIHTVVVARVPDQVACVGRSGWLAPYWSALRGAPLVLCHTASATAVEREVEAFVGRYGLRPRSITLLADYASIGTDLVEFDAGPAKKRTSSGRHSGAVQAETPNEAKATYRVQREPCVAYPDRLQAADPPRPPTAEIGADAANGPNVGAKGQFPASGTKVAAAYGVGRMPLASLAEASVMFVRGVLRQRVLGEHPARVLMISNSGVQRRPLPLCELISRTTAQEFKNWRLPVHEFYGKLADSPEVLAAARSASLIIYEGHVAYQDLIYVPYSRLRVPDEYYEEARGALQKGLLEPRAAAVSSPVVSLPAAPVEPAAAEKPNRLEEPLRRLPVVILQSCDSLDEQLLDRIDELGCTAVIGSVTPIHSGSGSMLMHALAAALLQRQATLGEALRDAQNFLFCLEDLKVARAMAEHARRSNHDLPQAADAAAAESDGAGSKSRRVALSFRLWGDPELAVLGELSGPPQGKSLSAAWSDGQTVVIRTPGRYFPEVRSSAYYARLFPGSQIAGLVIKAEPLRRVLPAYYFQLPLPRGFSVPGAILEPRGGGRTEAVFRVDPLRRFLCLLYLPDAERPEQSVELQWRQ